VDGNEEEMEEMEEMKTKKRRKEQPGGRQVEEGGETREREKERGLHRW